MTPLNTTCNFFLCLFLQLETCNTTANYSFGEKLDTERRKLIKHFNILYLLKNLPIFPLFERLNKSFSSLKENQHLFQN